jgi:hypothetical protein
MKLTVITDQHGEIIGTARQLEEESAEAGDGGPIAGPDQSSQVIDLAEEPETTEDPEEFYRQLKGQLSGQ